MYKQIYRMCFVARSLDYSVVSSFNTYLYLFLSNSKKINNILMKKFECNLYFENFLN